MMPLSSDAKAPVPQTTVPLVRSRAAERMRRHRERRRDGLRCLTIELRETEIWTLVNKGLLKYEMRNNVDAIKNALYAFLDQALG
jgi:hypothetical protein